MSKTIRKTLPRDFSVGILILIFGLVFFLSGQLFEKPPSEAGGIFGLYLGEILVSIAVIVMILILWEEILFPVKIKPVEGDGLEFRNHRTKLKIQALIYLIIPAIVTFLYLTFDVNVFRFFAWAAVCMILPVVGKLVSGINNYNDFLKVSKDHIVYKNNEKEGSFATRDIEVMEITKDDSGDLQKLHLQFRNQEAVIIDLDEMELEAFYESIEEYLLSTYKERIKK